MGGASRHSGIPNRILHSIGPVQRYSNWVHQGFMTKVITKSNYFLMTHLLMKYSVNTGSTFHNKLIELLQPLFYFQGSQIKHKNIGKITFVLASGTFHLLIHKYVPVKQNKIMNTYLKFVKSIKLTDFLGFAVFLVFVTF